MIGHLIDDRPVFQLTNGGKLLLKTDGDLRKSKCMQKSEVKSILIENLFLPHEAVSQVLVHVSHEINARVITTPNKLNSSHETSLLI